MCVFTVLCSERFSHDPKNNHSGLPQPSEDLLCMCWWVAGGSFLASPAESKPRRVHHSRVAVRWQLHMGSTRCCTGADFPFPRELAREPARQFPASGQFPGVG